MLKCIGISNDLLEKSYLLNVNIINNLTKIPMYKFVPIFKLVNHIYPKSFSVFIEDRNGNWILTGDVATIYSLDANDMNEETIESNFKSLLHDVYDNYGKYSRKNRLDFVFNNMKQERKNYKNVEENGNNIDIEI